MKIFTLLFALLILFSNANAQSSSSLQTKFKKMQERSVHFSKITATLQHLSGISADKNTNLKSAQATLALDSVILQDYNAETQSWLNNGKDVYLYNTQLLSTEWQTLEWDESSENWVLDMKTELGYNDAGLVNVLIMSEKDELSGELVPNSRISAFYNPAGLLDSVLMANSDDGEIWINITRQDYFYSETGQLSQLDLSIWDEEEEGISQVMHYYYDYDDQDRLEFSRGVYSDNEVDFTMEETSYFYDASGRRSSIEYSVLDALTFELGISSRTQYEYNETGDVSTETYSDWDAELEDWVLVEKDVYTYSNTNFSDVIFPTLIQMLGINVVTPDFIKTVTEINTFDFLNEEWVLSERTLLYYSDGTATSTPQIATASVNVYPNPFSDVITFSFKNHNQLTLEIFTVTGAKIVDRKIYPATDVQVSNLNKGVYLFRLMNENQIIHSGKLIKR